MVKIPITVLVSWNRSRKKNYRLISYRIFRNLLIHSKRILLLLYKEQSAVVSLGSTPIWTNPNWTKGRPQLDAMQKKFQADWKHNGSFLLNAPWENPWSSGPWQNPWMLRFIISMGFAMELWENPLHGKTHISWVLPWYMGFAIDLWQNPWDTLIRPRHAVPHSIMHTTKYD